MTPSTVWVTFIDDGAQEMIATVNLPIADLPDTFEIETTLKLGDAEWSVVHADPQTKGGFSRSGKLMLHLRRIEKIDLSNILYSLPSICDQLPAVEDTHAAVHDLVLAEDDWRQFELVSRAFTAESDVEITAIRSIHDHERAGVGWKKIHIRKRPDPPIASTLSRKDIDRTFGGVTFRKARFGKSPIISGFSFQSGDLRCYGIEEEGTVTVLGIAQEAKQDESVEALTTLARDFDLELVQWCRCARAAWDDPRFRRLLTGVI